MKRVFVNFFAFLIPFPNTRRQIREKLLHPKQYEWKQKNLHNFTTLGVATNPNVITVGRGTYGVLNVEAPSNEKAKLVIGNFCSIGPNVHFILASEHPYHGFSTYPFKVKLGLQQYEAKSKGDIIVDDDVWIGHGVIINSGVHIGRGAIVASGAVVVKDVEPYCIVGGNPAKQIKYRFADNIRKKLMKIDFANLNTDEIAKNSDVAYMEITEDNVDKIIETITQRKGKK